MAMNSGEENKYEQINKISKRARKDIDFSKYKRALEKLDPLTITIIDELILKTQEENNFTFECAVNYLLVSKALTTEAANHAKLRFNEKISMLNRLELQSHAIGENGELILPKGLNFKEIALQLDLTYNLTDEHVNELIRLEMEFKLNFEESCISIEIPALHNDLTFKEKLGKIRELEPGYKYASVTNYQAEGEASIFITSDAAKACVDNAIQLAAEAFKIMRF